MSAGYVDLHCHYLPGVDDGVRTFEDGVALCRGLAALGFETVVATPHMRTAMFDNRRDGLEQAFASFSSEAAGEAGMPTLGLGSEHYFDDVFWERFLEHAILPYPGGHAALVELPAHQLPYGLERHFFTMRVRGVRPVLAHPERYRPMARSSEALTPLIEAGALPLLDLMSLVDHYGSTPRRIAERLLDEGVYFAACSDAHRPEDVTEVGAGIARLRAHVGDERATELLSVHPRRILGGDLGDAP